MNSFRASLIVLLLFIIGAFASAKEVTDTLYSVKNDRIIVTYVITQKGNKVDLQFKSVRKQLGDYHYRRYKREADKIHIIFFDWVGVRKDMRFTGETPSVICLPAKASYTKSRDGYFIVEQRPTISFGVEDPGTKTISIPLYMAHYEGKQHYKILCSCGNLVACLPNASPQMSGSLSTINKQSRQGGNEYEEIVEDFSEFEDEALMLIKLINKELPNQDTLPMASTLERKVENLVDLQAKIKNEDVVKKIDEAVEAYNSRKKDLERSIAESKQQKADDDAFTICNTKDGYELYLKQYPNGRHVEEAKGKVAELEAKAKEEEDKNKKRTIWMIVGGVLLAILLFVGNQVLQSFRNIRTQRSMMQMQQDATKRAQNMASGKVKSEIRKQTNKVTGQVKKKGQTAIRDAANKVKNNKGNNRVSI